MENGMLVDLRRRGATRDRLLFTPQTTMFTFYGCHDYRELFKTDMPQQDVGIVERQPSCPSHVTGAANPQVVQPREAQPKVRRAQPGTSASSKVATVHALKATTGSATPPTSKKADTPPRIDAQKERLFRDFQEWQKRKRDEEP
jgi:hypothetical protein